MLIPTWLSQYVSCHHLYMKVTCFFQLCVSSSHESHDWLKIIPVCHGYPSTMFIYFGSGLRCTIQYIKCTRYLKYILYRAFKFHPKIYTKIKTMNQIKRLITLSDFHCSTMFCSHHILNQVLRYFFCSFAHSSSNLVKHIEAILS
jgi:hypothetical protein